jgi:molybdopterin molybdotransferase
VLTTGIDRIRASPTPAHCTRCPHRSPIRGRPPASTYENATDSAASSTSTNMPLPGNHEAPGHNHNLRSLPNPGRFTRMVPVSWDGATARAISGHGSAFLRGAALADALAAVPLEWRPRNPVPLILPAG